LKKKKTKVEVKESSEILVLIHMLVNFKIKSIYV